MKNNSLAKIGELSYEKMDQAMQLQVDKKVEELRNISSSELLTYGIEAQTKVSKYANRMLTQIDSSERAGKIEEIMTEVLDVSKPFVEKPKKKGFLQRAFGGWISEDVKFDRSMFAGKIDVLVSAIEEQVGRLIAENVMYDDFCALLYENVESIGATIVALERYMDEVKAKRIEVGAAGEDMTIALQNTATNNLLDQLAKRKSLFMLSRQESMQVAASAMIIQKNNIELSDRLQTLLVVGVPILQNQILLKASMADTKRGLDICENVSSSIDAAMKQNASQLKSITAKLSGSGDMQITGESVVQMSKDILSVAQEMKKANQDARAELSKMESEISKSEATLEELFTEISAGIGGKVSED